MAQPTDLDGRAFESERWLEGAVLRTLMEMGERETEQYRYVTATPALVPVGSHWERGSPDIPRTPSNSDAAHLWGAPTDRSQKRWSTRAGIDIDSIEELIRSAVRRYRRDRRTVAIGPVNR